jgi:hypothetical protein
MSRRERDLKLPPPPRAPGAKPEPEIREALDLEEREGRWYVYIVLYQGEACERIEHFISDSGPEAASKFMQLAVQKSIRGRTGQPHPAGERIIT